LKTARGSLITTIAELRWQERLSKRRSDARVEELQQSVADLAVRLDHAHSETEQGRQEMAAMAEELAAKTAELRAIHASLTWRLSHPFKRRE
jgi:allophanate hydrolase subunit 1